MVEEASSLVKSEAFWAAGTAVATTLLFIVGLYQVREARKQAKGWRTLAACERYDSDPILDRCARRLFFARKAGVYQNNPKHFRIDITTLLNYFDGISIGVEQRLYIEEMVYDHLEQIVKYHVDEYLNPKAAADIGIERSEFEHLVALDTKWKTRRKHATRFQEGWRFPFQRRL